MYCITSAQYIQSCVIGVWFTRLCNNLTQHSKYSVTIGERHILSLKVKCDNTPNGCKWIGELRSLENHLTNNYCGFTLLPCPNECKRGNETIKLLRKDIKAHKNNKCPRRQYECPHCRESGEYQERTTTHHEECPKMKIPCPNDGCDEKIERCDISQHRQKRLYEEISCKYTNIGCKKMLSILFLDKPWFNFWCAPCIDLISEVEAIILEVLAVFS